MVPFEAISKQLTPLQGRSLLCIHSGRAGQYSQHAKLSGIDCNSMCRWYSSSYGHGRLHCYLQSQHLRLCRRHASVLAKEQKPSRTKHPCSLFSVRYLVGNSGPHQLQRSTNLGGRNWSTDRVFHQQRQCSQGYQVGTCRGSRHTLVIGDVAGECSFHYWECGSIGPESDIRRLGNTNAA